MVSVAQIDVLFPVPATITLSLNSLLFLSLGTSFNWTVCFFGY